MDEPRSALTPEQRLRCLFEVHYAEVLAYVRRRVDDAVAEEVVADVFVAAWRHLDDLPAEPRPWLYRAASFEVGDRRREHGRRQRLEAVVRACERRVLDPDPSEEVVRADRWASAFGSLAAADQEVLRLSAWEGLSAVEGAEVIGCSAAAFKVRLHRARRRLRDRLGKEDDEPRPADVDAAAGRSDPEAGDRGTPSVAIELVLPRPITPREAHP